MMNIRLQPELGTCTVPEFKERTGPKVPLRNRSFDKLKIWVENHPFYNESTYVAKEDWEAWDAHTKRCLVLKSHPLRFST
jgi:hypothetical protein